MRSARNGIATLRFGNDWADHMAYFLQVERLPGWIGTTAFFRQKATHVIQKTIVPSRYSMAMVSGAPRAPYAGIRISSVKIGFPLLRSDLAARR